MRGPVLAAGFAGLLACAACREPTQIRVEVSKNFVCPSGQGTDGLFQTGLTIGTLWDYDDRPLATQSSHCGNEEIGSVIITPNRERRGEVAFEIVSSYRMSLDECLGKQGKNKWDVTKGAEPRRDEPGCIWSSRIAHFSPHETIRVPIELHFECMNVPCGAANQVCVDGQCLSNSCEVNGGVCELPDAVAAGGASGDGGAPPSNTGGAEPTGGSPPTTGGSSAGGGPTGGTISGPTGGGAGAGSTLSGGAGGLASTGGVSAAGAAGSDGGVPNTAGSHATGAAAGTGGAQGFGGEGGAPLDLAAPATSCRGMELICRGDDCCAAPAVDTREQLRMGMGLEDSFAPARSDEGPEHAVTLSPFYLERYEVTVGRFRRFRTVVEGGWLPRDGDGAHPHAGTPLSTGWQTSYVMNVASVENCLGEPKTWTPLEGDNEALPINCVDWSTAFAFCIWDGGRLPTEAEWEYAAAGGGRNTIFPTLLASDSGVMAPEPLLDAQYLTNQPTPVGLPASGRWTHRDLSGNVAEWVFDAYGAYPDDTGICDNCINAADSDVRVIRGGGYNATSQEIRAASRSYASRVTHNTWTGFRCARDR